ncbi:hypothetical protein M3Y99_01830200 [Aphelenchoides fujianensis]|nr:hypothetical protein M3Y99_01830200 [Aphelenchoides fujianensis]
MWMVLLFMFAAAIPVVLAQVNDIGIPNRISVVVVEEVESFKRNVSEQVEACFEEHMKSGLTPRGKESYRTYADCLFEAPKDYAVLNKLNMCWEVEHKRGKSEECAVAVVGLDLGDDPRLNLSVPFTSTDRSNVCLLLGDYKDHYCKVRAFCPESQEFLKVLYTARYLYLHIVATGGKNTDEDCPVASLPFAQMINPNAYHQCFDPLNESLLNSMMCD